MREGALGDSFPQMPALSESPGVKSKSVGIGRFNLFNVFGALCGPVVTMSRLFAAVHRRDAAEDDEDSLKGGLHFSEYEADLRLE